MTGSSDDLGDDEWLFRRIYPGSWVVESDRPFSNSFEIDLRREEGLSVYRATLCRLEDVLMGHEGFGVVRLRVRDFRARGLIVTPLPVDDQVCPERGGAHAEVRTAAGEPTQIPRAVRRALADQAGAPESIVVRPISAAAEP